MEHFGEAVAILLSTYGACMSLVRKLGRHERSQTQERLQSARQLRRRLRSDRSQVGSLYSAQLSQRGTAFRLGDRNSLQSSEPGFIMLMLWLTALQENRVVRY